MRQHKLTAACTYINDFTEWYLKNKSVSDYMIYVNDRFSKCSKENKQHLCSIFNKLSSKILDDGSYNSDTYELTDELMKILEK